MPSQVSTHFLQFKARITPLLAITIAMTCIAPGQAGAAVPGAAWACGANSPYRAPQQQALDSQGNVYVTACDVESSHIVTYKIDATTGQQVWRSVFNDSEDGVESPKALSIDRNGDVFVVARLTRAVGGMDFLTIKYDGNSGAVIWSATFNGTAGGHDLPAAIALDLRGNAYVTGYVSTAQSYAMHTIKYSGDSGALVWSATLAGVPSSAGTAIAVDSDGDVAVTGYGNQVGNPYNFGMLTVRYAGHSGSEQWRSFQQGVSNGIDTDRANAVAVDHEGNVLVTGFVTSNQQQQADMRTIKYARDSGTALWSVKYNGPANATDQSVAIALNASGDAFITGGSPGVSNGTNIYTARYAGTNGAIVWEATFNSFNSDDGGHAIAVDRNGDAIVTGRSFDFVGKYNTRTLKYAGGDGQLLWNVVDDSGPGNNHDSGGAVAADFDGNIFVTGQSADAAGLRTMRSIKYSRNGQLRWLSIESGTPSDGPPLIR